MQACQRNDYSLAAQYLDLREIPEYERPTKGRELAKKLEAILNADGHFDVLRLSQAPEGNLGDDSDPGLENIATVARKGITFTLQIERASLQPNLQVWLFSSATVSAIPSLTPEMTNSVIEQHLPGFLVSIHLLDTAIWKWLVLLILTAIILLVFRLAEKVTVFLLDKLDLFLPGRRAWIKSLLQPWLVFLSALIFGAAEAFINPSALGRLYIGRFLLLVVVLAFAWCLINIVDLFLTRVDSLLDPRQRMVSHSLIYMGKRAAKVAIFVIAVIIILDNWGYNMTTMIAGLGVGGIAIALAAQGTIANVFGGVSVIADHPVMVGDFGNFGGVLGTVEDIGLRSTRVRTLNRTIMSIPNASFASMNLENYGRRDKILFNPTLQVKRGTPTHKMNDLMEAIKSMLKDRKEIEVGPSPVRINTLTVTAIAVEIFAYVLTPDIDEFYKMEAELFLKLDSTLSSLEIDLA